MIPYGFNNVTIDCSIDGNDMRSTILIRTVDLYLYPFVLGAALLLLQLLVEFLWIRRVP